MPMVRPRPGRGGKPTDDVTGTSCPWQPLPAVDEALRQMIGRWTLRSKEAVPARLGFTSALRGEGVSFLSRSLARVVAHDLDASVCLVDCNWWGADSGDGAPPAGLADVLRASISLDEAVLATEHPKLWLLPAGPATEGERPALAHSARLSELLDELNAQVDHVLLDLPALAATGDALALAASSHGCVFVVRQGVTTAGQVATSMQELRNVPVMGVVLNRTRSRTPGFVARRLAG